MSDVKSDIQIAREAKMQPINDILAKINVPDESSAFSPMGRHIAKINLEYLETIKDKKEGKLILVTAITSTPVGDYSGFSKAREQTKSLPFLGRLLEPLHLRTRRPSTSKHNL